MENENICKFIPDGGQNETIHIVNIVLETKIQDSSRLHNEAVYKMHFVSSGEGYLHTSAGKRSLKPGDVFFTFPSTPYALESGDGFEYLYVTYLGTRSNKIYESLKISRSNCIFCDLDESRPMWLAALNAPKEASGLRAESLILYVFSMIAERTLPQGRPIGSADAVLMIKKHIDDNISSHSLTLESISSALSYNAKYVSTVFKRKMGIGISEYISTVRIQHACALMEQGFSSIKDIASLCGFKDALYFSRVFKSKMGISPSDHMSKSGRITP